MIIIIYFKSITQRVVAQSLEPGVYDKSGDYYKTMAVYN